MFGLLLLLKQWLLQLLQRPFGKIGCACLLCHRKRNQGFQQVDLAEIYTPIPVFSKFIYKNVPNSPGQCTNNFVNRPGIFFSCASPLFNQVPPTSRSRRDINVESLRFQRFPTASKQVPNFLPNSESHEFIMSTS